MILTVCLLLWTVPSFGWDGPRAAAFYQKAFQEQQTGDLDGALEDYSRALEFNPRFAAAYSNRGNVRKEKGDLDGAVEDYSRALKLDPRRPAPYFNRGKVRYDRGDLAGALDDYNHGIKRDRKQPMAYYNRGKIEEAKADGRSALADYTLAIKLNTNYTAAYASRGTLRGANGDLDGALADYDRALRLDPKRVSVYFKRGLARQRKGDLAGAEADFEQCALHADGGLDVYARIRLWLLRAGRGDRAAADQALAASLPSGPGGTGRDWPAKVASFLLNRIGEDELLAATASPRPEEERGRKCEFWYYTGMKALLAGDKRLAAADFRQCLATGERSFVEFEGARTELDRLGG